MADYVNKTNYHNMIQALRDFATKTADTIEQLTAACSTCIQTLGEDDVLSTILPDKEKDVVAKYAAAIEEARRIADAMEEELNQIYERERKLQELQEASGDDD